MGAERMQDELTLATVAALYYVEHMSQHEIASRLGVSRATVSRMLIAARERGIVSMHIRFPIQYNHGLARSLEQTFGLRQAVVVQGVPAQGAAAAQGAIDAE